MPTDDILNEQPLKMPLVEVTLRIKVDHEIPVHAHRIADKEYPQFVSDLKGLLTAFEGDLKTLELRFERLLK